MTFLFLIKCLMGTSFTLDATSAAFLPPWEERADGEVRDGVRSIDPAE
jgi:hypothetical protein